VIFLCKAILFDMDGVLVNSGNAVERVWRKWAVEHKLDPEYVIEHAHGRRSAETLRVVAPELEADQENLKVEQMEIEDKEGIIAVPGATELLRSLPPERFTIVTSATPALALARLQYVGIPVPDHFITADDVVNGKPSPEPYLKGAALLGFDPPDCLVFEDTPAGIRAAKAAGMRVIALQTTYPAKELTAADAMVKSLAEVEARLKDGVISLLINSARSQSQFK
jgi:sugar-phosphatase